MSIIHQGEITNIEIKDHWQKDEIRKNEPTKLSCLEFNSFAFDVVHILTDDDLLLLREQIEKRLNEKMKENE